MEKPDHQRRTSPVITALKGVARAIGALFKGLALAPRVILGVACIVAIFGCIWLFKANTTETHYLSSSDLTEVVEVSELNTVELTYRGIVQKTNDKGKALFNVAYEAKVRAGIDLTQVTFEVDNDTKTVSPVLPTIEVRDPTVNVDSLDYLPASAKIDLKEIVSLCKDDAKNAVATESNVEEMARKNARSAIEALTSPLLKEEGYTLSWNHDDAQANGSEAQDAETEVVTDAE